MSEHTSIELAGEQDLAALVAHMRRQLAGDAALEPPVSPRGKRTDFDGERAAESRRLCWSLRPGSPGWGRSWIARLDGEIVGHAELIAPALAAEAHRATLGLGVEAHARRRGLARGMLEAAIAFAQAEPAVGWIELGVFEDNAPARALYESLGFREVGRTEDRFRVDGWSITDVHMSLAV